MRRSIGENLKGRFGEKTPEIAEKFDEYIQEFADKHGLKKEEIVELMIGFIDYAFDKEGEIEKVFTAVINENFHNALMLLSDYILIGNWYDKKDLENVLGEELTDEKYNEIVKEWNDNGNHNEINEVIRTWYDNWFEDEGVMA